MWGVCGGGGREGAGGYVPGRSIHALFKRSASKQTLLARYSAYSPNRLASGQTWLARTMVIYKISQHHGRLYSHDTQLIHQAGRIYIHEGNEVSLVV